MLYSISRIHTLEEKWHLHWWFTVGPIFHKVLGHPPASEYSHGDTTIEGHYTLIPYIFWFVEGQIFSMTIYCCCFFPATHANTVLLLLTVVKELVIVSFLLFTLGRLPLQFESRCFIKSKYCWSFRHNVYVTYCTVHA